MKWMGSITQEEEQQVPLPPLVAESIASLDYLEKLPVDIEPMGSAYRGIHEGIRNIISGRVGSEWYAVVGLYGTGKTLLLRRIAHEAVNNYHRIIPIYFYMGRVDEILLFRTLQNYVNELERYVSKKPESITVLGKIHGNPEAWRERLSILQEVVEEVKGLKERDFNLFVEVMKRLNDRGYYPLVIFDEFERLVYTGEGLGTPPSGESLYNFAMLSDHFHELTRGVLFSGIGVIALTDTLENLIEKADKERDLRPHVKHVEEYTKVKYINLKFSSPTIVFNGVYHLDWSELHLETLCNRLGVILPKDFIVTIAKVLPTPRAILSAVDKARRRGFKLAGKRDVYKLLENEIKNFMEKLRGLRTSSGRPVVYATSKWDEWLVTLLEHGYYYITREDLAKIGELLIPLSKTRSEKITPEKVASSVLNSLLNYGVYERRGKGVYVLRRELLALFLGIERLPTGERADINSVMNYMSLIIEERRRKAREYREKQSSKG